MKKILVIGSLNMDFVADVSHIPTVGETILAENFELVPGGKGANQSYAIGKMHGNVAMLGIHMAKDCVKIWRVLELMFLVYAN